jgi:hypothetical protein
MKTKLTKTQREAVSRILYLVEVLRHSDLIDLDGGDTAFYDGADCDGWCFKDDVTAAAEDLSEAFSIEIPTVTDEEDEDTLTEEDDEDA